MGGALRPPIGLVASVVQRPVRQAGASRPGSLSGSSAPQAFRTGVFATFGASSFQNPSSPGATSNAAAMMMAAATRSG